jgi:hypothetical protein
MADSTNYAQSCHGSVWKSPIKMLHKHVWAPASTEHFWHIAFKWMILRNNCWRFSFLQSVLIPSDYWGNQAESLYCKCTLLITPCLPWEPKERACHVCFFFYTKSPLIFFSFRVGPFHPGTFPKFYEQGWKSWYSGVVVIRFVPVSVGNTIYSVLGGEGWFVRCFLWYVVCFNVCKKNC